MKKLILIALFLISSVTLVGCGSQSGISSSGITSPGITSPGSAARGGGSYLDEIIPANILSLKLFDQSDKSFSLGELKGQYVVISNFLTSCQEICPMTSATMRVIGDAIEASALKGKVKVIEISVDGARDKVARLAAYFSLYNDSNFALGSGSDSDLKAMWTYFGAPAMRVRYTASERAALPLDWQSGKPSAYDVTHPDLVLIVGPDSHWKWLDLGNPNPGQAKIPEKLKKFLSEDGLNNLAKPQEPSWSSEAVFSALHDLTGVQIS
ncbi:MAG: SCO family protein [Actinomycetes bacterium]